jgi:LmbE family N-acetylglucosaminyl deacetylase
VLALGGLLGDVEMGCGGTLLKHRQAGTEVVVVPLCEEELEQAGADAAREAAGLLGARVELDPAAMVDTAKRAELVRRIVRALAPRVAFVPALDDGLAARREAFRIGMAELETVPLVLGYQTATTGTEFRPARFEDVGEQLMDKMEALTAFQGADAMRPDLAPRMAQAYARYWGRLQGFTEVEAFEIVRG